MADDALPTREKGYLHNLSNAEHVPEYEPKYETKLSLLTLLYAAEQAIEYATEYAVDNGHVVLGN